MTVHKSPYQQTIERIEEERAAAIRGLMGPAILANHASIEARLTRGANHILDLIEQKQFSEAQQLMEHASWGEESVPTTPCLPADEMLRQPANYVPSCDDTCSYYTDRSTGISVRDEQ
jgi:hypothetical protein